MRGRQADHKFKLHSLLKPLGGSVVINACLLALMARAFTATPVSGKRYMSVELRVPVQTVRPQIKQVVHKTLSVQAPPKPRRTASAKPFSAVLPYQQEMGTRKTPSASLGDAGATYSQPGTGTGELVGPASTGTGPGVNLGNGVGDASGNGPVTSTPNHAENPPQAVKPQPPKPVAPKPAPIGETRNAQLSRQIKPAYPADARDDGVEGVVSLTLTVSPSGRVSSTRIEKSSGDRRLDQAALDAVRSWIYSPCLKNGNPVESTVRIHVDFRLE